MLSLEAGRGWKAGKLFHGHLGEVWGTPFCCTSFLLSASLLRSVLSGLPSNFPRFRGHFPCPWEGQAPATARSEMATIIYPGSGEVCFGEAESQELNSQAQIWD